MAWFFDPSYVFWSIELRASMLLLLELLYWRMCVAVPFLSSPVVDELVDYVCTGWCE